MELDIENLNPGVWFDWVDDAKVCLRVCPLEELQKIAKVTSKVTKKFRRGTMYEDVTKNEDKEREMLWDYCINDWENIETNGVALECTTKNKLKLMLGSVQFAAFIADCMGSLNEYTQQYEDDLEKN